jgi:hypothetical protein
MDHLKKKSPMPDNPHSPALQTEYDDLLSQLGETQSELKLRRETLLQYQEGMKELPGYTKKDIEWIKKLIPGCRTEQSSYSFEPPAADLIDLARPLISAGYHEGIKIGQLRDAIRKLRKRLQELEKLLGIGDK